MREDCQKALWKGKPLIGRKIDLCEGCGQNGRQNPLQQDSDRLRHALGLESIPVAEPQAMQVIPRKPAKSCRIVSKIGTRLSNIFREEWGAIPCGDCKAAIEELNGLTVDEVRQAREHWVKQITANAKKAAPAYWQKLVISADQFLQTGGTEYVIGTHLDKACELELNDGQK